MNDAPPPSGLPARVCILSLHPTSPATMPTYKEAAAAAQAALEEVEAARELWHIKQRHYFRLSQEAARLFEGEHREFLANLPNLGVAVEHRKAQLRAELTGADQTPF